MDREYLGSAKGEPEEIEAYQGTNPDRLWLEQEADMIELDDQQASRLIDVLQRFLARA